MSEGELKLAVIGAGSWGTALARIMCGSGCEVFLWARNAEMADELQAVRENRRYLPGFPFEDDLIVTADMEEAAGGADVIIVAVPSYAVAEVTELLAGVVKPGACIVSASKGLDSETGRRLTQVIGDVVPECRESLAALSGPNLAVELAAGAPTAGVIASTDAEVARFCRVVLGGPTFRLYTSPDVIGVELGGALKNVMAIGAGICDGMGFGDNAKAALLTRGLAEMMRLGEALGARSSTFSGLSGVGDLIATASSRLSRNLRVGLALGQGRSLDEALAEISQVAEGVPTTRAVMKLAEQTGVDVPICAEIHATLFEGRSPEQALRNLMARTWKDE